ncbi:exported hypothetical protein [metagenome]|uniref:VWFA domain-containing protein n=1 Tax=metagenome TaxID=256318 RepID=A0A2P2C1F1_9ZZZZ
MSKHTPKRRRDRGNRTRWAVAAVTAAVLSASGLGWWALGPDRPAAARGDEATPDCASRPAVTVATTAGFAPVLSAVADDACVALTTVIAEGSTGARLLSSGRVDVWVPDSRERAFIAGPRLAARAPSTATSPVVMTASASTAATLTAAAGRHPSWGLVLGADELAPLRLHIQDPASSGVALALSSALRAVATRLTHDRDTGLALTAAAMLRLHPVAETQAAHAPDGQVRIVEERLVRPDLGKDPRSDAVIRLAGGSPALDYPWVAPTGAPKAADLLLAGLLDAPGVTARAAHGFREPGIRRFTTSSSAQATPLVPAPPVSEIPILYALATAGGKPGNTLAVVDISGSMNEKVRTGLPLIHYVRESVKTSLSVLSDQTKIGLWQFGSRIHAGRDYQELVPMQPLSANRRQMITAGEALQARQTGTGLYNTALAAYRRVQRGYDPAANNVVTIFTDGRNEDSGGLDLPGLLTQLRAARDPRHPVSVLFIAYGDADRAAMARIVGVTGGSVFPITRPTQIIGALMAATAQTVISEQRG